MLRLYLAHDGHDHSDLARIQRYRRRLLKSLKSLRDAGVIHLWRGSDSLCQWLLTSNGLNLIRRQQNSNFLENPPNGIYSLPRRARQERYRALNITAGKQLLTPDDRYSVSQEFDTYLDDVTNRRIILCHAESRNNPDAELYFLPYKTRFTDMNRKKTNLNTYEAIWDYSSQKYKIGVFLTLTTDPHRFRSSYHANKHFQVAFNRLMSFLKKKYKERPKYLNVHEFTAKGLLHSHIIIFGIDYLAHYKTISEWWDRCGQGRIVHIYGIRHNGVKWTWSKAKPKYAKKGQTPPNYLKKYLKKSLFEADELELYWAFNKRFFTYSRSLRPATPPRTKAWPGFYFIGSAPSDMVSVLLERRSRILWSQAKRAETAATADPPW